MFIMTKEEVQSATRIWAANVKAPIDRDLQIQLMKTAQERRMSRINKLVHRINEERKGQ
jgi:hypothetical protein